MSKFRHILANDPKKDTLPERRWELIIDNSGDVGVYCDKELMFRVYNNGIWKTWDSDMSEAGFTKI